MGVRPGSSVGGTSERFTVDQDPKYVKHRVTLMTKTELSTPNSVKPNRLTKIELSTPSSVKLNRLTKIEMSTPNSVKLSSVKDKEKLLGVKFVG